MESDAQNVGRLGYCQVLDGRWSSRRRLVYAFILSRQRRVLDSDDETPAKVCANEGLGWSGLSWNGSHLTIKH
jgi:hypothetical protein